MVDHCGRPVSESIPCWAKNCTRKRAGNDHICPGSDDHTAAAWGTSRRSTNHREKPSSSRKALSERSSSGSASSRRAARLKRA
jgi:hypothetical protein